MQFDQGQSFFINGGDDPTVETRAGAGEIHPSGPLWGNGDLPSQGQVAQAETARVSQYAIFKSGLEQAGLKQQRRAFRLNVLDADQPLVDGKTVKLRFALTRGAFATSVLRELVNEQTGVDSA